MKAKELKAGDWFRWGNDWRVFQRMPGGIMVLGGKECVPVKPLQPTPNNSGGYIPVDSEVVLWTERKILKLMN